MSTFATPSTPTMVPSSSPMYSIGASSLSPSPIATLPSNGTLSKLFLMASTAAASAAILSPLPRHFALAIAAISTASRK